VRLPRPNGLFLGLITKLLADRTFKRRQAKNYVEEQQHLQARPASSTD